MTKKKMKDPLEASPSSYQVAGEEPKARFRLQSLIQDYEDLVKEIDVMRSRLQTRKQQKLKLSAEVNFLRRKYKSLLKNKPSSQSTMYSLKTQYQNTKQMKKEHQRTSPGFIRQSKALPKPNKLPLKERKHKDQEAATAITSLALDLNQISVLSGDEEDYQVGWEPSRMESSLKQCPHEAKPLSCDLNVSVCRDAEGVSSRTGKRKISWQDQVALRV